MSIIRTLGVTIKSLEDRLFISCSTANAAGATFALFTTQASTANVVQSSDGAVGISGRVIDRLGDLFNKDIPLVAVPATHLHSSRGSTATDRKLTLGVKLQHGDSSGGGDMADYSTQAQPDSATYFTSAMTTDMVSHSTGVLHVQSPPAYYDLRAAKRYIRAVHIASKNDVSTESTGYEDSRLSGTLTFLGLHTPELHFHGAGAPSTTT